MGEIKTFWSLIHPIHLYKCPTILSLSSLRITEDLGDHLKVMRGLRKTADNNRAELFKGRAMCVSALMWVLDRADILLYTASFQTLKLTLGQSPHLYCEEGRCLHNIVHMRQSCINGYDLCHIYDIQIIVQVSMPILFLVTCAWLR